MKRDEVPPGRHLAIPTKLGDLCPGDTPYAHRCGLCIAEAARLMAANMPEAGGRVVRFGDTIRLREESRSSCDPATAQVTAIRLNSYTGEVWIHCFALGDNRILKGADVEEIVG